MFSEKNGLNEKHAQVPDGHICILDILARVFFLILHSTAAVLTFLCHLCVELGTGSIEAHSPVKISHFQFYQPNA